jgi:hypothetical protein
MKLLRLKNVSNETYNRHQEGIYLSDMFPIKNSFNKENALSSMLLNFALVYAVRSVQVNQDSLKLNGTY